jgi:hypothetical protein
MGRFHWAKNARSSLSVLGRGITKIGVRPLCWEVTAIGSNGPSPTFWDKAPYIETVPQTLNTTLTLPDQIDSDIPPHLPQGVLTIISKPPQRQPTFLCRFRKEKKCSNQYLRARQLNRPISIAMSTLGSAERVQCKWIRSPSDPPEVDSHKISHMGAQQQSWPLYILMMLR